MKRHLRFIRDHRRLLRVRLNAEEDLLVNGVREPTHRGKCVHLLGKIDHHLVTVALDRIDDPRVRRELLAGIVRFSTDDGILVLYLEALTDSASRAVAASAFPLAMARLDFEELGPARFSRLLEIAASVFVDPHERASVVFGLMHTPGFRETFREASASLPRPLGEVFRPLLAVYEDVVLGDDVDHRPEDVSKGAAILLSAPEAIQQAWPPEVRLRLLRLALARADKDDLADRAAGALLGTLPPKSDEFREFALLRASMLLRAQADARAKWELKRLKGSQPKCEPALQWLDALAAPRVGRMALPPGAKLGKGMVRAFWLDEQRPVWLRVGRSEHKDTFLAEAKIHGQLALPGVAPLLVRGTAEKGKPWVAVPAIGRPAHETLRGAARDLPAALWLAWQGTSVLAALATAGWKLPDARAWRFLLVPGKRPTLLLADLTGIESIEGEGTPEIHKGASFGWAREVLGDRNDLPARVGGVLFRRRKRVSDLIRALALEIS
ncbi:MAG: hypothetical protein GY898_23790 [Proteobacteria bacterium]|nr:hypothetical protein [Pseudomonadota bacterium]